DDGYAHIFENIVPLLQQHKVPATFAIPLSHDNLPASTGLPFTGWPHWLSLSSPTVEIAAHAVHHTDLTHLSLAELETELREPAAKLQATTIVYPGGAVNDAVQTAAQQYYQAGRTTHHGFETLSPHNPLRLRTFNFTRHNFSPFKANILALWAYLTNSWLIETYHIVSDEPTDLKYAVSQKDFQQHIRFLTHLPVAVRTIRDVISHHSYQK
ncbi:MAG: polysaccharide deacetylase family protein, partial [Patescibacteria group bacterium]